MLVMITVVVVEGIFKHNYGTQNGRGGGRGAGIRSMCACGAAARQRELGGPHDPCDVSPSPRELLETVAENENLSHVPCDLPPESCNGLLAPRYSIVILRRVAWSSVPACCCP